MIARTVRILTLIAMLSGGAAFADDFVVDTAHSRFGFGVTHLVINTVHGDFKDFKASLSYDPATKQVTGAEATIQATSIDTGIGKRDNHLRSADFFDVAKYPTITFKVTKVLGEGGQQILLGDFTMHGVTKELRLPVTVKGPIVDPWGNTRIALSGTTTIDRTDYGLSWDNTFQNGAKVVSHEVTLTIELEATQKK